MLMLTSYTAMECKYGLLSQVTSPTNAVCSKPGRVSPSYHLHSDKHLHRGLYTVFFQKEICLGKRHTTRVSPEEHPCLTPLPGPAPNQQRCCHGRLVFFYVDHRPTWEVRIFVQGAAIVGGIKGWQLRKWLQKQRWGWEESWFSGILENHQHKGR